MSRREGGILRSFKIYEMSKAELKTNKQKER